MPTLNKRDMKFINQLIILFLILFSTSSCQRIVMSSYGIKDQKQLNREQIKVVSQKVSSQSNNQYFVTNTFKEFLNSLKEKNMCIESDQLLHQLQQPIQVITLNSAGQVIHHVSNCDVGGFPNLKWASISTFTDNMYKDCKDANVNFIELIFPFLYPLNQEKEILKQYVNYDYVYLIFWNRFAFRQSKRLIEHLKNIQIKENALLIYVNNDNFFP